MASLHEKLIRNSDNLITLTLIELGVAIGVTPTEVDIVIDTVVINRTPTGNGITFSSGILEISPIDLTSAEKTALDLLAEGRVYNGKIVIKTATDVAGVVYGDYDSDVRLYFLVTSNPV